MRLPHTIGASRGVISFRNLTQPTFCGLRLHCRRELLCTLSLQSLADMLTGKYAKYIKVKKNLKGFLQSEVTWCVLSLQDLRELLLDDKNPDFDLFMMLHQTQYSTIKSDKKSKAIRKELTKAQIHRTSGRRSDLFRARSYDKQIYKFFRELLGMVEMFIAAKWDFLVRCYHIRLMAGIDLVPTSLWNPHYMREWQLSLEGERALERFQQYGQNLPPKTFRLCKSQAFACARRQKKPTKKKYSQ